jgi:hypothetical protein
MTDIPESAERARAMYSEGVTTREILEATGFSHWMLSRRCRRWPSAAR